MAFGEEGAPAAVAAAVVEAGLAMEGQGQAALGPEDWPLSRRTGCLDRDRSLEERAVRLHHEVAGQ